MLRRPRILALFLVCCASCVPGADAAATTTTTTEARAEISRRHTRGCASEVARRVALGREAQRALHANQHPPDCSTAKFLVCRSTFRQAAYLGLGARSLLFGRCLTYALVLGRVALLSMAQPGVREVHGRLMQPWSSTCKMKHAKEKTSDTVHYNPRSVEEKAMRVKGTDRVPPRFAHAGRAWWQGQEQAYVMRPSELLTAAIAEKKRALGWREGDRVAGMHVRRGDKTKGGDARKCYELNKPLL